jgi:glutamate carboxypeptidase
MTSTTSSDFQPSELVEQAEERLPDILADIERVISIETPSSDKEAVAAGARDFAALLHERLGAEAELLEVEGTTHLRLRFGTGPARVVLLNHQDTVWPHGTSSASRSPPTTASSAVPAASTCSPGRS